MQRSPSSLENQQLLTFPATTALQKALPMLDQSPTAKIAAHNKRKRITESSDIGCAQNEKRCRPTVDSGDIDEDNSSAEEEVSIMDFPSIEWCFADAKFALNSREGTPTWKTHSIQGIHRLHKMNRLVRCPSFLSVLFLEATSQS